MNTNLKRFNLGERVLARSKDASASSKSLVLIACVLAIAGLYVGRQVLMPFALALVLSFLLTPFVTFLQKIRFGRVPAVLTVVTLSFVLLGAFTWGVAGQLVQIMVQLPDYKDNLDAKIQSLHTTKGGDISKATASWQELNKELSSVSGQISAGQISGTDQKNGHPVRPLSVQVAQPPRNLVEDLRGLLGPLAGPIETALIVVIFTLFMLVKREDLRNRAIRLAGHGQIHAMTQALDDAGRRLSRYLLLQCLVNAGYGALFGLGLYLLGVPHALLWGAFAAVLRFVPFLGSLIAAILPVALALAVFPGWHHALYAFAIFLVLELVVSNVVEPLLYGAHTGISSLAILVAAVFWAMIWGPIGLILSTPLTVCLIVLGRHVPQLNFLEVVLGDEPVLLPDQCFYQRLLARDLEEARAIAQAHLSSNSLESLYDTVILPALKLVEQDYQRESFDEGTRKFVLRSIKDLIDDLGEADGEEVQPQETHENTYLTDHLVDATRAKCKIACIPSTTGPDELVATMLVQLLRQAGYEAREIRATAPERMVHAVIRHECTVACVSSISSFSGGEARVLCRRLRAALNGVPPVMGMWSFESSVAQQRLGSGCPSTVVSTLAEAVADLQKSANPEKAEIPAEPQEQNLPV
jgi:predicted PurR-regulated permease PerM